MGNAFISNCVDCGVECILTSQLILTVIPDLVFTVIPDLVFTVIPDLVFTVIPL